MPSSCLTAPSGEVGSDESVPACGVTARHLVGQAWPPPASSCSVEGASRLCVTPTKAKTHSKPMWRIPHHKTPHAGNPWWCTMVHAGRRRRPRSARGLRRGWRRGGSGGARASSSSSSSRMGSSSRKQRGPRCWREWTRRSGVPAGSLCKNCQQTGSLANLRDHGLGMQSAPQGLRFRLRFRLRTQCCQQGSKGAHKEAGLVQVCARPTSPRCCHTAAGPGCLGAASGGRC